MQETKGKMYFNNLFYIRFAMSEVEIGQLNQGL